MGLLSSLTAKKGGSDKEVASSDGEPAMRSQPTALYKTATGTGSRRLEGPFPGHDLSDHTLVACLLAGYPDERVRAIYAGAVSARLGLSGAPPLTNPGESAYHAYQRAQTRRATAYRDLARAADPVEHRLGLDKEHFDHVRGDGDDAAAAEPPGLVREIEQWRYIWQDVAQTLESDGDTAAADGDADKAAALATQAGRIRDTLAQVSDDDMCARVRDGLARRLRHEQATKQFDEQAAERRGLIAANGGTKGDAGYKNPRLVIETAEKARSLRESSSDASMQELTSTSVKDFAANS